MFGRRPASMKNKTGVSGTSLPFRARNNLPLPTDATVEIPYVKAQDNPTILPKYLSALARPKNEYLPAEDLDAIQLELELLLSSVAQRLRILKAEYETIEKEDKKDRKNKIVEKPPSPGKRKRTEEKKSKDRFTPSFKIARQRQTATQSPAQSHNAEDSSDAFSHNLHHLHKDHSKPIAPKNDTPNKFWLSVEPYCMPITNEDIKLLEELMEQYSGPLVPPIPELGQHFSSVWAANDLKEENENSNFNSKMKNRNSSSKGDGSGLVKKGERLMGEGITGPLTQRLVSVLMEDNLVGDGLPSIENKSDSQQTNPFNLRPVSLMRNGISIEKRLKKELVNQGILDQPDSMNQEDEVLSEIKRVSAELSATAEFNSIVIRKLHATAKEELARLELKRKLDAIDQEIIESYKKVLVAKQKRRQLTSQERDEINRLTAEQKKLSDQLESMQMPGPTYVE